MTDFFFRCKNCNNDIKVKATEAGQPVECPECKKEILAPPPGIKPKMTIGDFRLIRCLGTGGMGEVWLAYQDTMDRNVALKILSPTLTEHEKFVSRFMQEVKISAKLQHPNIVTSFYAGVDKGIYYLAISYVDGEGLDKILFDDGMIPEKKALTICLKVAQALKYAWNKFKIVHRDIKPANIMISQEENEIHLMDMGISKNISEDSSLTITGMIVGTPYYMSPEQARGDIDLDFRADIYSLGSTLFHLVTGEVPYDAPNTMGILTKLISDPFPSPKKFNPDVSEECCRLLEKMMQKKPENRQQNWEEVIGNIHEILTPSAPTRIVSKKEMSATQYAKSQTIITPTNDENDVNTSNSQPKSKEDKQKITPACPSCKTINKMDALFCVKCGKSISKTCPECSEKIPIFMNFCSKCGTDIKTILQLEDTLAQVKAEKEKNNWHKLVSLCEDIPTKNQLKGKKVTKIITEIIKIKNIADKHVHLEEAYEKADKLAKEFQSQNKNIEALNALHAFLLEYPKSDYTPEIVHRINKLKKVSYQGPEKGKEWVIEDAGLLLLPIPAGNFQMGSAEGGFLGIGKEKGRRKNEGPQHEVTISSSFWMAKFPVTISEFITFLDSSENKGEISWPAISCPKSEAGNGNGCWDDPNNPMVEINWLDATNFCKWLTARELRYNRIPDGYIYRLPTEAEWEYCCRAGSLTKFFFGDSENKLIEYAWYKKNSHGKSQRVGQKKPNQWGLHDMLGNVWEWCQDKYGDYSESPAIDPFGSSSGVGFSRRGGSWINDADHCRSAYRNHWEAKSAYKYLGFRLVLAPTRIRMRGTVI